MKKINVHKILKEYKPQKPKKFYANIFRFLLFLVCLGKKIKYTYHFDKKQFKNKQTIFISDHSSRDTFYYSIKGYKLNNPNVVIGYQNVIDKTFFRLFLKIGAIPKQLYTPDPKATKSMLRLLKEGCSLCFFPEGIQSVSGFSQPTNPATIKFLKAAKVDVILAQSKGTYLNRPRFSKNYRHGPIEIDYYHLFSVEELQTLTEQELYEKYLEYFYYNDFAWNQKARNIYKGKEPNATKLDNILFWCPKCNTQFNLFINNDKIECHNCNNSITVNRYYDLIKTNEDSYLPYDRIDKWYLKQREIVENEINNPDFKFEYDVILRELKDNLEKVKEKVTGKGKIIIYPEKIIYVGTRNNQDVTLEFDIKLLPSAPMVSDIGNEFYYENGYYEFDPIDDTRIAVKVMIMIELLHNKLDPVWDKYSKDVFNKENL